MSLIIHAKTSKNVKGPKVEARVSAGVARIRIVDYIGVEGSNESDVRAIVDTLIAQQVTDAEVYLNTGGGSVFVATEIVNQLKRLPNVRIIGGALIASAGTYITSHFYTAIARNTQMMVHMPMLGVYGNVPEIKSSLKLLENLTADYKSAYVNKTKSTDEKIEALWAGGDYWMTADEALTLGFVDEIIEAKEITEEDSLLLEACAAPKVYKSAPPSATPPANSKNSNNKMEKPQLIAALGLAADATDEQIAAKIAENKRNAEAFTQQQVAAENLKKLRAKQLVEAALLDKRISAEEKDSYEALAIADYDNVEKVLGAKAPLVKPTASIPTNPSQGASADPRANWTLEDFLEKDPEAYERLEKEDPARFAALEAAYFNKK